MSPKKKTLIIQKINYLNEELKIDNIKKFRLMNNKFYSLVDKSL